jgi:hypothetical protein
MAFHMFQEGSGFALFLSVSHEDTLIHEAAKGTNLICAVLQQASIS